VAVDNLNLRIHRGEVFGLLGPNGAGKTTTILMLLGLTEPSSGSAFIDGLDCARQTIEVKRFVGYLPDNAGFYNDMSGMENLMFTAQLNGLSEAEGKKRAKELLSRVVLTDVAANKVGTYSRGMRQRLAIADILMKDPKVIILDEPTLGIDPEGMRELLILIRELSEKDGRTVVVSSHQLHQVQQICDRVGLFVNGRLIAHGKIEDLASQLSDEAGTQTEISIFGDIDALWKMLNEHELVESVSRENDLLLTRSREDIRARLAADVIRGGFELSHLRLRSGDLDEIYQRYFEKEERSDG
jgi:ABC-2 type transport system ATP-binding protein